METINLSIGVSAASVIRFIVLETAITLVAAPLITKSFENLAKRMVSSGKSIEVRAVDFGWLTPVTVAFSKENQNMEPTFADEENKRNSKKWISVVLKLVVINALLLAALVSTEMTAGARNERVMVKKPVKRHSDLKHAVAAISVDDGVLLDRVVEIERCTRSADALHYQTVEGFCRARESKPSAWATIRGREDELLEKIGDQRLMGIDEWTNNKFQAVSVPIEGHSEKYFFWRNDEVSMYCNDLKRESDVEVGTVNGHCAVMFNKATRRMLYLVKVHRVTAASGLDLTIDRSDNVDVLGIELDDTTAGAENEIMLTSVFIAKRYLVLGVSIAGKRIIQEYYTDAAKMARILRAMVDGYGGDAQQMGEYYTDVILATQSTWSVIFLTAVVLCSLVFTMATRPKAGTAALSVPFDLTGLIKKLAATEQDGTCNTAGKWPVVKAVRVDGELLVEFNDI
ncbi:unnamed protein product [Agarophyton chilense]